MPKLPSIRPITPPAVNKENNLWKLGFVTKETLDEIELPELAAVYFPHSYNFSGELYLVPSERLEKLDI